MPPSQRSTRGQTINKDARKRQGPTGLECIVAIHDAPIRWLASVNCYGSPSRSLSLPDAPLRTKLRRTGHPSPSFLVALLSAGRKLDLLLRGQQRCLHDLSEVNINARLRIVSHAPTSPQIGSAATAGFDS